MIISPSVLSMHYEDFRKELEVLDKNVEWIHFDVMDGHFVPNLTFGPDILKAFRRTTKLFLDVHLMVDDPDHFSKVFINAGADSIVFHYEAYDDIKKCEALLDKIHGDYVKAGIAIKPATPVSAIEALLPKCDIVLVMSVEPGFGGQKFMPSALDKIAELARLKKEKDLGYVIEIDGGINDRTAHDVLNAGGEALVAGSFVFNGDMEANIDKLRKCR